MDGVGAVGGGKTVVIDIGISGVVIQPHGASVIVLIISTCIVAYRQTVMNENLMVGISAPHLKSVSITLTRILRQGDGDGVSVPIGHLRTYLGVKPRLIHTFRTGIVRHVVIRRSVLIADTVLDDGVCVAHTLEEIPTVVGVVPCPASDIVVSVSGELLIGKTVCVTAEISRTTGHRLIVEVIVRVHVLDDVVSAILHLASGVCRTVDIQVLEQTIRTLAVQVVLAGPSDGQIFNMHVKGVGVDRQTTRTISHFVEIQDRRLPRITGDHNRLGCRTLFVHAYLIAELVRAASQKECVPRVTEFGQLSSKRRSVRRRVIGGR